MVSLWLALAGTAVAQDLDQLEPGPYATASWDWEWDTVRTTNPDSGARLDVTHYGRMVYPVDERGEVIDTDAGLPVVVFGHGRFHGGPTLWYNHLEADYLLQRLASWGIVATSVNLDVVGAWSFPAAIPQRGDIIRTTLARTYDLEAQPGSPPVGLSSSIDPTRAVIIGHSRGGEGVVAAAVQNRAAGSPLPIVAVATIAPTDFEGYRLEGLPYMGIYGSKDGDVNNGWPNYVHDRATSDSKLFHYIHGANHFWFTESINYDGEGDADFSRDLHHDLAMGYLAGFAYRQLFEPDASSSVFVGPELESLSSAVDILSQYRDPERFTVDGFEVEPALGRTDIGTRVWGKTRDTGAEVTLNDTRRTLYHLTKGLEVSWNSGNPYWAAALPGEDYDATDWPYVSVKLAQLYNSPLNSRGIDQDLNVALRDTDGDFAIVRLSDFGRIIYPVEHPEDRFEDFPVKTVLQTTRIPLDAFAAANPLINLDHLVGVGLKADVSGSGHLFIDDVEFTQ